jgi:hypothetical protein
MSVVVPLGWYEYVGRLKYYRPERNRALTYIHTYKHTETTNRARNTHADAPLRVHGADQRVVATRWDAEEHARTHATRARAVSSQVGGGLVLMRMVPGTLCCPAISLVQR